MTEHPPDLDLAHLSRLAQEDVRLLWVNDFWDGALEGIAEYQGERCLFVVAEPHLVGAHDEMRRWVLYRLTTEQLQEEERWHALFVAHVGGHFDHTGTAPHEAEQHDPARFYGAYQADYRAPQLERSQAVGWFSAFTVRS
ncbi:hypothetical protein F0U60_53530 [Archangium minus]|uniref:Uncharacterized protein n=1 Tax=Archangium minus TaxID=83450 RepID=A0ABY9X987_9BACT|nr:hypothetical protein F0U60_53530 [Archangium minus]